MGQNPEVEVTRSIGRTVKIDGDYNREGLWGFSDESRDRRWKEGPENGGSAGELATEVGTVAGDIPRSTMVVGFPSRPENSSCLGLG